MTLQTKLVVSFTVLLLAVVAAVGVVASRSIEDILVAQTDRMLLDVGIRGPRPDPGIDFPALPGREPPPGELLQPITPVEPVAVTTGPFVRSLAELWVTPTGEVVRSQASGFADDPDPLPDVAGLEPGAGPVFLDSTDDSLRYRAATVDLPDGSMVVYAAPLREVATATTSLVRALLLAGGAVLLLGAAATWWTVRRAVRPVDEMVATAEAIAGGDLASRVPEFTGTTELTRLGGALNDMLSHIEDAVESERQGQERLRRFVADASHELRTPITAIAGYAELHRRGGLATLEAGANAWSRIESESRRMTSLVAELLTLARLDTTEPLETHDVDLSEIARGAAADHAAIDPVRPIELTGDDAVVLRGDEERLHQVVSNLLGNVRTHTPQGTHVTIDVARRNGRVELSVTDDGPGIPEASLPHVFDRFYRADPSRSRRSGGSGLGLAIVRAIVDAHGGTVAAVNTGDGGARITVALPAS
jgi:two-component system OmpR family sensor kinase